MSYHDPVSAYPIRPATLADLDALSRMFADLWPQSSKEAHGDEIRHILSGTAALTMPITILVAESPDSQLIGFLEVDLRSHADGCDPAHPVGYIEGWYVAHEYRQRGVGKTLVEAAEDWARRYGCTEIASDAVIDNVGSQEAHQALGYEVVDRCVHYRKGL